MKFKVCTLFFLLGLQTLAQNYNLEQLGHLTYDVELSDIWGYVDEQGNEYALIGLENNFSVVDLTDPFNPTEIFRTDSAKTSAWRDVKTWGDYAYITCECGPGLLIVDLTPLPESNILTSHYWNGDTFTFTQAHNLFIDEKGVAYIFGADFSEGGAVMLDLTQDPMNPVVLGVYDENYLHDGVVRGDTLWGAAVNSGELQVVDVSDKINPVKLASWKTPGVFTHNAWLASDGKYIFTTDEIKNGSIAAYDVSNIYNPVETDKWKVSDTAIIPHNTHWKDGYLINSHYTYGVNIIDVSRPHNMLEVAHFDTSPDFVYEGFFGCWGVYPWLPSENIIASDIEDGLYILKPTYRRGAFLEGKVTDQQTGGPVFFPTIHIIGSDTIEKGNISGDYAIATLSAGIFDVAFSAEDYYSDTVFGVQLQNGEVKELNVELSKWPVGERERAKEEKLEVFPNPSDGRFTISNPVNAVRVEVYNATGRLVHRQKVKRGENWLDVSNEKSGVYNLLIFDKTGNKLHEVKLMLY